jgi:hypothetical protein
LYKEYRPAKAQCEVVIRTAIELHRLKNRLTVSFYRKPKPSSFASFATFCSNSLQTFCDCGTPNAVKFSEVMSRQKSSFLENQLKADQSKKHQEAIEALRRAEQKYRSIFENATEGIFQTTHATFEDYCRERWSMSYRRAAQLMDAAETVQDLNNCSESAPTHESQVRPLTGMKTEQKREAWVEATKDNPTPTAAQVAEAKQQVLEGGEVTTKPANPKGRKDALKKGPFHRISRTEGRTPDLGRDRG